MRRFTRLTNAFSKKVENHICTLALYFMHYNFFRPHMSLGDRTPAQVAGIRFPFRNWKDVVEQFYEVTARISVRTGYYVKSRVRKAWNAKKSGNEYPNSEGLEIGVWRTWSLYVIRWGNPAVLLTKVTE